MKMVQDIIIKPIITEASMDKLAEKKYTFKVASDATKPEIASAVEAMFGVKVASVNTISMKKKPKRLGVHFGYTSDWKKAVVTLTADSKSVEELDGLGVSSKSNYCLLPIGSVSEVNSESLGLFLHANCVNGLNLYAEHSLNRICDLGLCCVGSNLEGVLLCSKIVHGSLGDYRLNDYILNHFHYA